MGEHSSHSVDNAGAGASIVPRMALTLSDVEAAIAKVATTGQKYRLRDGTEVTRADLAELRALRDQLTAEQTGGNGTGFYRPIGFGRVQ